MVISIPPPMNPQYPPPIPPHFLDLNFFGTKNFLDLKFSELRIFWNLEVFGI